MKLKLPEEIISPQDVKSVSEELNTYARDLRRAEIKKRVTNKKGSLPNELTPAASAVLGGFLEGKKPSPAVIEQLANALSGILKSTPQIRITLADIPPLKLKQEIVRWFRDSVDSQALVDFRFSSVLLGGMVVSAGSHTYDWSWRKMILGCKVSFSEVLRRV